ncbi:MAG: Hpt domain-containing protein [Bdellovibrionales bacterium]|nr:Hpt domain-containing protein [Bdellovibrionales bacterium]
MDDDISRQIKELLPFFFTETVKDLDKLENYVNKHDFESLRSLAHTLKGECGGYGFSQLSHIAEKIETAANEEKLEEVKNYIIKFRTITVKAQSELLSTEEANYG